MIRLFGGKLVYIHVFSRLLWADLKASDSPELMCLNGGTKIVLFYEHARCEARVMIDSIPKVSFVIGVQADHNRAGTTLPQAASESRMFFWTDLLLRR